MKLKPIKIFIGFIVIILITKIFFVMESSNKSSKPLVIYIAENDHGDMSYGSLMEQIIKDCHEKGLSTKIFSEFPSQTTKSQKQKARTSDLMSLKNSSESVEETAKFLDSQFIEMGSIQARCPMWNDTWKSLPEGTTTEQLVLSLKSNVDNPELLRLMEDDLKTGAISGADKTGDLENFYAYWRSPLHYKQTHEQMAKDVKDNLKEGIPDVIIMVAGTPHIKGLDQQLTELKNSKKIVVGNVPQCSTALENFLYSGNPKLIDDIGITTGFEVDLEQQKAIVPDVVIKIIDEKSQSKESRTSLLDALDLDSYKKPSLSPEKSYVEKMLSKTKGKANEI